MPEGSGEVSGDGLGAAGLSLWDPVPVTCWAPSPHLRSDLGGGPRPTFPKGGEKIPLCCCPPCNLGQVAASRHRGHCSLQHSSVFVGKPSGSTGWVFGPHFFGDSAPNGYGGGCQRCPKPQPSTALKYLYRSEGKASPWCGWEPPATGFPCEGGRWSPL